jgi:subtilisin family serine protease
MSLGGPASQATDDAVARAVAAGVTVVVAAGNENQDACNVSPARAPSAITVGASDNRDARASFSNWGTCVDLFGPGVNILSAAPTSNTATATMSGTSMATPHVAGVAALVLSANPSWTPAQVTSFLVGAGGNPGKISDVMGSPNVLLYTGNIGTQTPTRTTAAPTTAAQTSAPPATTTTPTPGSQTVTGNLNSRSISYEPKPDQKYSVTSRGVHRATLTGPAGTDFDLYLLRYSASAGQWVAVASGTSASSNEVIAYTDADSVGTQWFSWQIYSYSGSGTYTLTFSHP